MSTILTEQFESFDDTARLLEPKEKQEKPSETELELLLPFLKEAVTTDTIYQEIAKNTALDKSREVDAETEWEIARKYMNGDFPHIRQNQGNENYESLTEFYNSVLEHLPYMEFPVVEKSDIFETENGELKLKGHSLNSTPVESPDHYESGHQGYIAIESDSEDQEFVYAGLVLTDDTYDE